MALITIKIDRPLRELGAARVRRRGRRAVAVLGTVVLLIGGVAAASAAPAAGVVSIPAKVLLNNVTVGAHKTAAVTVLGGSTTVPTDATRVVLVATVTNPTVNGSLFAYPRGNKAGASGDSLPYTAGQRATGAFTEQVGTSNQVSFANQGTAAITLSVSLTGYSTEVRAGDIAANGGSAGQVLTNTGAGSAWEPAGHAYRNANLFALTGLNTFFSTVASVNVPPGSYVVTFTTSIEDTRATTANGVACGLFSPTGNEVALAYGYADAANPESVVGTQGLVATANGGTISAQCYDTDNSAAANSPSLIANSVGAVTGPSGNAPAHHAAGPTAHEPRGAARRRR